MELLQNNNSCNLPYLLGITPGVTSAEERASHLAWFRQVEIPGFRTGLADHEEFFLGVRNMFFSEQGVEVTVSLTYHEENGAVEQMDLRTRATQEHQEVFGDPLFNDLLNYYLLPQILSQYGPPSSVLIGAWHEDPFLHASYTVFSTVVIYFDLGFMIEYVSSSELINNQIRGCPTQSYFYLWTWSPEARPSLQEIVSKKPADIGFVPGSIDYFKPVDQVTSMTLDEFYNIFKDPQVTQCLETPGDLWPNPNKP
ncbi:MAG: hypothetical protein ABIU06_17930 [Anaerolineales bacterium]